MVPEVIAPVERVPLEVMLPVLREVEKRLVDEAVVAKRLVEVALVEVDWGAVKFWRVVEPETKAPPNTSKSAPLVVVALPPKTSAIELPPEG